MATSTTTSTTTTEHTENTVVIAGKLIHIFDIDVDWSWLENFVGQNKGLLVEWIRIVGALGDHVVFKAENASGKIFLDETIQANLRPVYIPYHGEKMKMFLDFSAGSYTNATEIFIMLR